MARPSTLDFVFEIDIALAIDLEDVLVPVLVPIGSCTLPPVFTLRCTQKLLKHLKVQPEPTPAPSTTVLGDWVLMASGNPLDTEVKRAKRAEP